MTFTAIHRSLGTPPGPLTDDLLGAAVAAGVMEATDLDWKSQLPPARGLPETDFPKDVAAMANSGGGIIVYGVTESQRAATGRVDVGEFGEAYERAMRSAAITAISPPVFRLTMHRLGALGNRAVAVDVPASVDGPHLIYRNDYFGAPIRNDSDTVWMRERQIEAMYRARFDERRHAAEALNTLFAEASAGRDGAQQAWLVAVAHPRIRLLAGRMSRDEARAVMGRVESLALHYAGRGGIHPLESVDRLNPRSGLRRWVFTNTATRESSAWKESWATIHHDGSVTLATGIGGHRVGSNSYLDGWQLTSGGIECAAADFMALVRETAKATGATEYDVRIGINWTGTQPMIILPGNGGGDFYHGGSIPLHRYTPVETTVDATESDLDFYWHVHDLAQDCVNQGGIPNVTMIQPPEPALPA